MTCPISLVYSARGKAYRAFRALTAVNTVCREYQNAVLQAAAYYGTAVGGSSYIDPGSGEPIPDAVLINSITALSSAQALVVQEGSFGGSDVPVDYATVDTEFFSTACPLTKDLTGWAAQIENADVLPRLTLARMAKRYAPAENNTQVMRQLKQNDLWDVIRFAFLCYHSLERIGMHRVIVAELTTLFTDAQAQDSGFPLYAAFTALAGSLSITNITNGYIPAGGWTQEDAYALLNEVSMLYATNKMRSYRYEITAPHPRMPMPPTPPSGPYRC